MLRADRWFDFGKVNPSPPEDYSKHSQRNGDSSQEPHISRHLHVVSFAHLDKLGREEILFNLVGVFPRFEVETYCYDSRWQVDKCDHRQDFDCRSIFGTFLLSNVRWEPSY